MRLRFACFFVLAVFLLPAAAVADKQALLGTWFIQAGKGTMVFRFLPNGRFTQQWVRGKNINELQNGDIDYYGTYAVDGDRITFTPQTWVARTAPDAAQPSKAHPPPNYVGQPHTDQIRIQDGTLLFMGEQWTRASE